jgi:hypothetical protein
MLRVLVLVPAAAVGEIPDFGNLVPGEAMIADQQLG